MRLFLHLCLFQFLFDASLWLPLALLDSWIHIRPFREETLTSFIQPERCVYVKRANIAVCAIRWNLRWKKSFIYLVAVLCEIDFFYNFHCTLRTSLVLSALYDLLHMNNAIGLNWLRRAKRGKERQKENDVLEGETRNDFLPFLHTLHENYYIQRSKLNTVTLIRMLH